MHDDDNKVSRLLNELGNNKTVVDIAREALGEGDEAKKVSFTIHEEAVLPVRMESKPRNHQLHTLDAVVAYLKKYGGKDTVVTIAADTGVVVGVLDEVAEKGRELVHMTPKVHPLFAPWADLLNPDGRAVAVKKFADFIARHRRTIKTPSGREFAVALRQVKTAKEVEIQEGVGSGSVNGVMVKLTIEKGQTDSVDLPTEIALSVPLFVGGPLVHLDVDLTYEADEDGAFVLACSPNLEEKRIETFEAFAAKAQEALPDALVVLGATSYKSWDYAKLED